MSGRPPIDPARNGAGDDEDALDASIADERAGPRAAPDLPGGRVFSVEGRPAPGLYFAGWVVTVASIALVFVGLLSGGAAQHVLVLLGFLGLFGGLSLAAGYQVVSRARRSPAAYHGPSPLILFGITLAASAILALLLGPLGVVDARTGPGFLVGIALIAATYLATVAIFVVRSGSLSWDEMGWPQGRARFTHAAVDIAVAVPITIVATFLILLLTALLATALGVTPPATLPPITSRLDGIVVALGAAFVAPIGEELFFRGYALTAWQRDLGPRRALIRSAVFFAVVHIVNVVAEPGGFGVASRQALLLFLVILPLALLLGRLFQARGIVASIASHITYNGTLLVLAALVTRVT